MKLLPLLISLTIISPNIYSNPLDQDIEDAMQDIEDEFSAFSPELTEEEKKQEERMEQFYDLFTDQGTEVKTETVIEYDVFGDELKKVSTYFVVDNQKYNVSVECAPSYNTFPFSIEAVFPRSLGRDFSSSPSFGHLKVLYKLENGIKGSFSILPLYIFNDSLTGLDARKFGNFNLSATAPIIGKNPLLLNLQERKKSMAVGEILLLIPILGSEKYYSLKFNPFHDSWADLYEEKCPDPLNTSLAERALPEDDF